MTNRTKHMLIHGIPLSIILMIVVLSCVSCSSTRKAARKLEKARKLTEQAAVLDPESVKADTIFKNVFVPVPEVRLDTQFIDRGVPVIVSKDRLIVKYKRDTITNEVFIEGECQADTIIKEVPVQVNKTAYIKESFWQTIPGKIAITFIALGVIIFILRIAFKGGII